MEETKPFQVVGVQGRPGAGPHMVVVLTVDGDTITRARYSTYGCTVAERCGQWVCDEVEGKKLSYAALLNDESLIKGVGAMPLGREHCSELAVSALKHALSEVEERAALLGLVSEIS